MGPPRLGTEKISKGPPENDCHAALALVTATKGWLSSTLSAQRVPSTMDRALPRYLIW